jgi:hypothetical protein
MEKRHRVIVIQIMPEEIERDAPDAVVRAQVARGATEPASRAGEPDIEYTRDVRDLTMADAEIVALARELTATIARKYADTIGEGVVIAGRAVREERTGPAVVR